MYGGKYMRLMRLPFGILALAGLAWMATPVVGSATPLVSQIPPYQHIVEIMMENQSYGTIIGNPQAPNINALANQYGLATNYFGVTHPSEPNYVANVGGSFFGVQDDNQFYCTPAMATTDPFCGGTTVESHGLRPEPRRPADRRGQDLEGLLPEPSADPGGRLITSGPNANGPYTFKWPSSTHALYASKHNPFVNFTGTQGALAKMVPDTQLATDLANRQPRQLQPGRP